MKEWKGVGKGEQEKERVFMGRSERHEEMEGRMLRERPGREKEERVLMPWKSSERYEGMEKGC